MQFQNSSLHLRPATEADHSFLQRLYASVREEELKPTGWSDEQKAAFIAMQFQAQHQAYFCYEQAEFFIVLLGEQEVGRLYLQHQTNAILIIDVSLMDSARGKGIGTDLLQAVITQAHSQKKSVRIHVEKFNPALHLYQRLGFQMREDKGVYLLLERPAALTTECL